MANATKKLNQELARHTKEMIAARQKMENGTAAPTASTAILAANAEAQNASAKNERRAKNGTPKANATAANAMTTLAAQIETDKANAARLKKERAAAAAAAAKRDAADRSANQGIGMADVLAVLKKLANNRGSFRLITAAAALQTEERTSKDGGKYLSIIHTADNWPGFTPRDLGDDAGELEIAHSKTDAPIVTGWARTLLRARSLHSRSIIGYTKETKASPKKAVETTVASEIVRYLGNDGKALNVVDYSA